MRNDANSAAVPAETLFSRAGEAIEQRRCLLRRELTLIALNRHQPMSPVRSLSEG